MSDVHQICARSATHTFNFWLGKEAREPRANQCRHREIEQTPPTKKGQVLGIKPTTFSLNLVPLVHAWVMTCGSCNIGDVNYWNKHTPGREVLKENYNKKWFEFG